ncbi:hypothetical protein [Microbispora rosea]|uniref:hypothetical protein n=1 Tax=Microbispora rosea TaxID=58117 RepID=UPI003D8DD77C
MIGLLPGSQNGNRGSPSTRSRAVLRRFDPLTEVVGLDPAQVAIATALLSRWGPRRPRAGV